MTDFRPLEFNDYLSLPTASTVLLTVNARLARSLHGRYGAAQRGRIWPTPTLLTPGAWVAERIRRLMLGGNWPTPTALLLTPERELWLWEQVIREQENDNWLLDTRDAARLAQEAHAIEVEWQLHIPAGQATHEYRHYRAWKQAFHERCATHHWIDSTRQLAQNLSRLAQQAQHWPQHIVLAGFDDISPLWQQLFDTLAEQGVSIYQLSESNTARPCWRVPCADADTELREAARWAQQQVAAGLRVGIVVPDLKTQRAHLARVFDTQLHPETLAPHRYEMQRQYNISLGQALVEVPLVHCAINALLQLAQTEIALAEWVMLLQSPFIHDMDTALTLGREEARWRERGQTTLAWDTLPPHLWALRWQRARQALSRPAKRLPSHWAEPFANALQTLGWPGARSLSSHEFQALTDFRVQLAQFATLDDLTGRMSLGEALHHLRQSLTQAVFQIRTEDDAPIQIVGLLEAGGEEFDATWVVGLTDNVLPAAPRPNPLLPVAVQQQADSPHASARRESRFASQWLHHLQQATGVLIASHAQVEGERELRPSPLISEWPLYPAQTVLAPTFTASPAFEAIDDSQGPPLPAGRSLRGGAQILQHQALNPLWAFFEHRLGARPLSPWALQPDPRLRGNVIHDIMEYLWQQLQSQSALQALSPHERHALISTAVTQTLASPHIVELTGAMWRRLEQQRLHLLLHRWLELECARPQPFHAIELESERQWRYGTLQLRLRIDRIDATDDGYLLIDYKTGKIDSCAWGSADGGAPLTDVQLPLYAMICRQEEAIAGIAIAGLYPALDHFGFKTPKEQPLQPSPKDKAPDNDADWQALQQFWAQSIITLAEGFVSGMAENRNATPHALRYCPITPLLRQNSGIPEEDEA